MGMNLHLLIILLDVGVEVGIPLIIVQESMRSIRETVFGIS